MSAERAGADEVAHGLEIRRDAVALAHEGHALADEPVRTARSLPERRRPPQVDRLRRDDELDREQAARPASTISASRRAARGAIVTRSSIPSAWVVETSSKETGWASSRASAVSACAGHAELAERVLDEASTRREPARAGR